MYEESDVQDTYHSSAQNLLMPFYRRVMFKKASSDCRIIKGILKHLIAVGVQSLFI